MRIVVLASGSEGNTTYIETNKHKILLDFGMNITYIKNKLKEINVTLNEIDYILITHTHNDHIRGISTLIKKYQPIICMNKLQFMEVPNLNTYNHIIIYEDEIILKGLKIETIKTSHDAPDSRGFIITSNDESLVYITDTGYLNQKYFKKLYNKEYYLFESNHDIEKLMNGLYPKWLKVRILGEYGHLSNKDASIYLTKLIGNKTKKIILMHLSEKNNTEEIALNTIHETFKNNNIEFDNVVCAKQKEIIEVN